MENLHRQMTQAGKLNANRKKKLENAQNQMYNLRKIVEDKYREYRVLTCQCNWAKLQKTLQQIYYAENRWKAMTLKLFNLQSAIQRGHYVHSRATLKFNSFVLNELNNNAWALERIATASSHTGILRWLGTHFSDANHLICEYISDKVWAEYLETKYNLQKILRKISLPKIMNLFNILETLAQGEGVRKPETLNEFSDIFRVWGAKLFSTGHWKTYDIPKEDGILFINTFLSGLKRTGRYRTVLRFVRIVAILFR